MRVVRQWNRLPNDVFDAPTLETLKVRLDKALGNLIVLWCPCSLEGNWTRWTSEVPSNSKDSVILWFCELSCNEQGHPQLNQVAQSMVLAWYYPPILKLSGCLMLRWIGFSGYYSRSWEIEDNQSAFWAGWLLNEARTDNVQQTSKSPVFEC